MDLDSMDFAAVIGAHQEIPYKWEKSLIRPRFGANGEEKNNSPRGAGTHACRAET